MKRPKGPELKMPELKAPTFLADLYYDLRDRRLLPLLALVLVAIAAVPFLLGGDSEELPPIAGGGVAAALESARERSAKLTVVEAKPGLRDYRKRLHENEPTDPFKQRYTAPSLAGAELNEKKDGSGTGSKGETSSNSATDGSPADGGSSPAPSPAPSPGGAPPGDTSPGSPPGKSGNPGLTFFAYAINVKIVKSVDGKQQDPIVRERVLPQTSLPGDKQPVVTYMGPARKGGKASGKALLLVSNEVTEIAGDVNCISGDDVCQLLEVEPGFPVVLTYGDGGVRYTVNVMKLGLVVTGHG